MEVNVAIAAQVTAYGRVLIRELINEIHQAGGVVAYSATEPACAGLKLEDNPKFQHLVGPEMGQFKLEREFKEGYFARTGLYALDGCTGKKATIIKHTGYNRPDIKFNDVKDLALYGKVLKRVKATWSQAIVTDKLGVRGAFSWIERNVNMSNIVGKAFPIEYSGLRIGIVPKFWVGKIQLIYASFALWRAYKNQLSIPSMGHSAFLRYLYETASLKRIFNTPLLPKVALSTQRQHPIDRDTSWRYYDTTRM
jgi:hypothetical protein